MEQQHKKIDEMDIYVWKKDYELVHNRKAELIKKKQVFPIILDQCLLSIRSQLEGAKTFEETKEKTILLRFWSWSEVFVANTIRTMISSMQFSTVSELYLLIFKKMTKLMTSTSKNSRQDWQHWMIMMQILLAWYPAWLKKLWRKCLILPWIWPRKRKSFEMLSCFGTHCTLSCKKL